MYSSFTLDILNVLSLTFLDNYYPKAAETMFLPPDIGTEEELLGKQL